MGRGLSFEQRFPLVLTVDQLGSRMKGNGYSGDLVQVVLLQPIISVTLDNHSVTQIQLEGHMVQSQKGFIVLKKQHHGKCSLNFYWDLEQEGKKEKAGQEFSYMKKKFSRKHINNLPIILYFLEHLFSIAIKLKLVCKHFLNNNNHSK